MFKRFFYLLYVQGINFSELEKAKGYIQKEEGDYKYEEQYIKNLDYLAVVYNVFVESLGKVGGNQYEVLNDFLTYTHKTVVERKEYQAYAIDYRPGETLAEYSCFEAFSKCLKSTLFDPIPDFLDSSPENQIYCYMNTGRIALSEYPKYAKNTELALEFLIKKVVDKGEDEEDDKEQRASNFLAEALKCIFTRFLEDLYNYFKDEEETNKLIMAEMRDRVKSIVHTITRFSDCVKDHKNIDYFSVDTNFAIASLTELNIFMEELAANRQKIKNTKTILPYRLCISFNAVNALLNHMLFLFDTMANRKTYSIDFTNDTFINLTFHIILFFVSDEDNVKKYLFRRHIAKKNSKIFNFAPLTGPLLSLAEYLTSKKPGNPKPVQHIKIVDFD